MWESVHTRKAFLYKAVFTHHPTVLNLHTDMYCIYPLTKKKQLELAILPKRKLFASSLSEKREDMNSLNIYLLNPLYALNISSPGRLLNRHRHENDHDLTSYTPLIPQ